MNIMSEHPLDNLSLRVMYRRYKSYGISVSVILVAIFLLLFFVVPQASELVTYKSDETIQEDKVALLNRNLQFLSGLNEDELDTKLTIATSALPVEKDFLGVLASISTVANEAGVSVDDYSFSVGELGSSSAKLRNQADSIVLTLELDGSIEKTTRFVDGVLRRVPLAEATLVEISQNSSRVTIDFPSRPISHLQLTDSRPLLPLSGKEQEILEQLRAWQGQEAFFSSPQQSFSSTSAQTP